MVELRVRAGLTTRGAARRLGISSASLNRTENAKREASAEELGGMLAVYRAGEADRKLVLDLAGARPAPGWLGLAPDPPPLARFEATALSIVDFAPHAVPGLLQTAAYTRAVHTHGGDLGVALDERVRAQARRQAVLSRLSAPHYAAFLDEAVLRRPVGGSAAMAEQIRWLVSRARQPGTTVRVVPFRHGGYRNPGRFSLMRFREAAPVVYVEHEGSSGFLDGAADVERFGAIAASIAAAALDGLDSVNLMNRIASDHERA
ncbi:hypothetical protein BJP25_08570 [Actinokineospora bangkokensis]|uniref:DUF5753 domain-containing protein n=1 Tax=Actinokineospora bangkokensis TaxID=1193682 RepID=A0A1Q9LSS5_9PSEU|nr:hypothetical protein BJP25_08570 [Actinokineospora bangkokensis]